MTLAIDEFIRRFLLHVLPDGFHHFRQANRVAGSVRGQSSTGFPRVSGLAAA
jgi:Putative transposase